VEIGLFWRFAGRRPAPTRWSAQADHWPQAPEWAERRSAYFQSALQAADFLMQPGVQTHFKEKMNHPLTWRANR